MTGLFDDTDPGIDGRDATLSDDGVYRYDLARTWGPAPWMLFVMLNPSTADARDDDPTIRRCIGFARREERMGIRVVNLFAYRATKPADLRRAGYPVGDRNDEFIVRHARATHQHPIVCAWGAITAPQVLARAKEVTQLLQHATSGFGRRNQLMCLGTTASGQPRHPLMLAAGVPLEVYREGNR